MVHCCCSNANYVGFFSFCFQNFSIKSLLHYQVTLVQIMLLFFSVFFFVFFIKKNRAKVVKLFIFYSQCNTCMYVCMYACMYACWCTLVCLFTVLVQTSCCSLCMCCLGIYVCVCMCLVNENYSVSQPNKQVLSWKTRIKQIKKN